MASTTDNTNPSLPKNSIAVTIANDGEVPIKTKKKRITTISTRLHLPSLLEVMVGAKEARRLMHGMKVGLALVLVSLLYILEVVHERLGDNGAMWAVMTVVVMFELTAGGTVGKGVNRGIGTTCGGGMGLLVALMAQDIGGWGKPLLISASLFLIGTAASYTRMIPNIKKKYDYGVLIFLLTFSLVAVSGIRGDHIVVVTRDRLSAIFMGFGVCIFTSVVVFPVWAGDDLQASLVSKFNTLATLIEGSTKEFFKPIDQKPRKRISDDLQSCFSVLHSKSSDESLGLFAKWEACHCKYGCRHPWNKYMEIGGQLRELAVLVLSLKSCFDSTHHSTTNESTKEQSEATGALVGSILKSLGANIKNMTKCEEKEDFVVKLQHKLKDLSLELRSVGQNGSLENAKTTYFLVVLTDIINRVEELVEKVGELGAIASFSSQ